MFAFFDRNASAEWMKASIPALAVTGGIGELDAVLRERACFGLSYLGVALDQALNEQATGDRPMAIHLAASPVEVWVIPTDEGRVAAREAARLLLAQ